MCEVSSTSPDNFTFSLLHREDDFRRVVGGSGTLILGLWNDSVHSLRPFHTLGGVNSVRTGGGGTDRQRSRNVEHETDK